MSALLWMISSTFPSDVDVLLDARSDVIVHDDQLYVDDVLMPTLYSILISDVVVNILVLCDVAVSMLFASLLMMLLLLLRLTLLLLMVRVFLVVASLVGVASLLEMYSLSLFLMLTSSLLYVDIMSFLSGVVVAECCHSCCWSHLVAAVVKDEDDIGEQTFVHIHYGCAWPWFPLVWCQSL